MSSLFSDKKQKHTWEMPAYKTALYFNKSVSKKLSGNYALAAIAYLDKNGKLHHMEWHHGTVFSVDHVNGVEIWENGTTKTYCLPPDLRPWERAEKGVYRLEPDDETVPNVDFISRWVVPHGHTQPLPAGGKLGRRDSGYYNFDGIGTSLYGHSDKLPDGSYTATKWVTFLLFPLLPLGTYRILAKKGSVSFGSSFGSHASEPVFLDLRQVVLTYLVTIPILAAFATIIARILS